MALTAAAAAPSSSTDHAILSAQADSSAGSAPVPDAAALLGNIRRHPSNSSQLIYQYSAVTLHHRDAAARATASRDDTEHVGGYTNSSAAPLLVQHIHILNYTLDLWPGVFYVDDSPSLQVAS